MENNNKIHIYIKIQDIEFSVSGDKKHVDQELRNFYKKFDKVIESKKVENYQQLETPIYDNDGYTISVDVIKNENNYSSWYEKNIKPSNLWEEIWKERK